MSWTLLTTKGRLACWNPRHRTLWRLEHLPILPGAISHHSARSIVIQHSDKCMGESAKLLVSVQWC